MFGLYIHIPFCPSKCSYCDFYSIGKKQSVPDEYISVLCSEIAKHRSLASYTSPDTVYFGGGTPSLLSPEQVALLLSVIDAVPDAEITLEANPNTITLNKLVGFKQAGVNRLSIGVQTASNHSLATLSRGHTAEQSIECFSLAKKAGFTNISGDLMLALPSYSFAECDNTIDLLAQNGCTHISSYLLKIEKGTRFYTSRPANLPDDDASADFYLYAVDKLQKTGFAQYEISNFAKQNYQSKHNLIYWNCNDYLGIGPAAHSCVEGKRYYYNNNLSEFMQNPVQNFDGDFSYKDYIMLQLRLFPGLSLQKLQEKYGYSFSTKIIDFFAKLQQNNLCNIQNGIITLTAKGMLIQNSILAEIL